MNPIKSPHELLMEEAGFAPASPGLVNSGPQMLLNQTGVVPHFAPGGKVAKGILSLLEREANKAKFLEGTKVVDYNGKPITMYHHTTDFQGDAFDPALSQQKDRGYHGLGMYFGADDYLKRSAFGKHSSGNVAGKEGFEEGSQVMPVNLSIKNPKYIDARDQSLYGVPSEELKKQGYDGVIVTRDDSFQNAMGRMVPRQKVYNAVAFEPTQVKSAIGNEGTFDPTDPRLHKAEGGSIDQQEISPQDMLAMLMAHGQAPQHFAKGGSSIMELYNQIPKKQEEYKKQQSDIAQGAADYYNQQSDPYFQNILNKASTHNFEQMSQEQNPEPTFQAQPVTPTSWTRDQFAKAIGDKPADRLFGTGSEGQKIEYMPLQFINPVSQITDTIGAVPEVANQLHEGSVGSAGAIAGLTALGAAPFAGPIKKIIKKIKHK